MKKILKTLIILLLLALVAYGVWYYMQLEEKKNNDLVLYGNVDIRQVDLGFRVYGRVDKLLFEEGDLVKQGDLLAIMDPQPYFDQLRQAEGQALAAKAAYEIAEKNFERRVPLKGSKSLSVENYEDAEANRNQTKATYEQAVAGVGVARTNLEDTRIYAPTEGFILSRIREPGTIVNIGQPVYTLSVKSPVWIRAFVNEPNLGRIYPNMKATIFTDKKDGRTYEGRIGFISPVAEFTPKTVETTDLRTDLVYRLRIYIDEPDDFLRQGMPVTVKLHTQDSVKDAPDGGK